jgi:hypothetical protein
VHVILKLIENLCNEGIKRMLGNFSFSMAKDIIQKICLNLYDRDLIYHIIRFISDYEIMDWLCGLVVRVSGYRSRGPVFDSRRFQIF